MKSIQSSDLTQIQKPFAFVRTQSLQSIFPLKAFSYERLCMVIVYTTKPPNKTRAVQVV